MGSFTNQPQSRYWGGKRTLLNAQSELQKNLTWRTPHIAPAIPAGRPSELASALQYPNALRKLEIASVGRYFHFL